MLLARVIAARVSQRLLPKAQGKGRVVAAEIMVSTEAIKEYITLKALAGGVTSGKAFVQEAEDCD